MRLAAISDLHIGVHAGRDGFGHAVGAFARWFDTLVASHDRVVLVGDVWQSDHGAWPGSRASQLAAARRRAPELASRFERQLYVHGNHDAVARTSLGAPSERLIEVDGLRLLFTHGHQFDPVANGAQWLADAGTYATGSLRRAGLARLARWFEDRDIAIKHARFGGAQGPYARGAAALASARGADVVVLGHTHAAELHQGRSAIYVNCGTCSDARREWVVIDTLARTVTLSRWPAGAAAPQQLAAATIPAR